jgi:hypothetical protein
VVVAAGVCAAALGGILAASGGAQVTGEQTIKLVEKNCAYKFTDVAPRQSSRNAPPGSGDSFTINCGEFTAQNARTGTLDARCTATKGGSHVRGVCDGVFDLADGHLYVAASLTPSSTTTGVVTGGDRAYAGARGTFTSVDRPSKSGDAPADNTITLIP